MYQPNPSFREPQLIFSEDKMQRHADQREARVRIAQEKKRPPRKPNSDNLGEGV